MNLSLAEAAMGAGAVLESPASVPNAGALVASGYSIDSRTIAAGDLFFAVRGERLDGHDYVAAALDRGAIAAVVSRARAASLPDAALAHPLLIAEEPLLAMQSLASHVRRQWGHRVVAITGSAGKTTTKEAVAAGLGRKIQRPQIARQSQQRLRAAAATAASPARSRNRRHRNGHESRR